MNDDRFFQIGNQERVISCNVPQETHCRSVEFLSNRLESGLAIDYSPSESHITELYPRRMGGPGTDVIFSPT